MTSRLTCEQARELAPELALETISGDERALLIAHISSCAACRALVEGLSQSADSLLLLAPDQEPPSGFENRVLARIKGPISRRANLWVAAAILLAAIAAAGAVWWATAEQRELGAHYAAELEEANGEYFGVKPLMTEGGSKAGNLFAYQGSPSWLFVVFADPLEAGSYHVEVSTRSDEVLTIGSFTATSDSRTWGDDLVMDLRDVAAVRVVEVDGSRSFEAVFPAP